MELIRYGGKTAPTPRALRDFRGVGVSARGAANDRSLGLGFGARQRHPEVDQIVAEDTQPDPALHPRVAPVATAIQPVAPFQHADAPFAARSPSLRLLEPALLLFQLAPGTLRAGGGHRHPFGAHGLRGRVARLRVEAGIRRA